MACWITDGSSGFTINGDIVKYVDDEGADNVFNCMWQEGDGVSSGKHYWKIHFQILEGRAGVGLTSKEHFKKGYACNAIKYLGNLSNGRALLVGSFGPSPSAGDVIGILAVFDNDRLKVYIDVNDTSLGLAFNIPASTFKSVFPIVSFHESGSATCTKQTEIPNITNRVPNTFSGIEGDWKLVNFQENCIAVVFESPPISKIRVKYRDVHSWNIKIANYFETNLWNEDGIWKTSAITSTKMIGPPELMKLELSVSSLIKRVNVVEIEANGNLSIKSDTISSTWTRYDSAPKPFVGEPFA